MPLKNKRATVDGVRVNLIPGETGVQLAEGLLLLRGDHRRIEVDVERWARRAPPPNDQIGAVLRRRGDGAFWDPRLAPSSVIDGEVRVDLPPEGTALGLPGFQPAALTGSLVLLPQDAIAEPFYVSSDGFRVDRLAFYANAQTGATVRVGLATAAGEVLIDEEITPVTGLNQIAVTMPLEPGAYHLMLWTAGDITLRAVQGLRAGQGWDYFASGNPRFIVRRRVSDDLSAGLDLAAISGEVTATTPGEQHCLLLDWTLT